MKIDLIITELAVGGAEICLTNLAVFLRSQSHDVRMIVLGPRPSPDRDRLARQLEAHAVETHFLRATHFWHFPLLLWKLVRLVQRSRPDIAQSFLFHANVTAAMVYPIFRVPLVGGARVVDPRTRRRWLNWPAAALMKRLVCVSQSVANHAQQNDFVAEEKLVVIPNGVAILEATDRHSCEHEPSAYAQKRLGLGQATPILLFVGRLDLQKGIDVLIDRADSILSELPLHHIVVIGDGPMKVDVQTKAARISHEARLHVVGRREDVLLWMQSSCLLLLPTRFEGMPNVVLEAMSCGLPVVATQAEGIVELLGDNAEQQTVPVGDWDAWQAKVVHLASSPKLRRRLADENRDRCERDFDIRDKMEQYELLYREILSRPSAVTR